MGHKYTAPDGTEVEAWQLTETSRYQDKLFPEWLNSRMFMTVNGDEDWLVQGSEEQRIPPYAWLVYNGAQISIVDAMSFEQYVDLEPEPPSLGTEDLSGYDEVRQASDSAAATAQLLAADIVREELKRLWEIGEAEGAEALRAELKKQIGSRVEWCVCAPGQCQNLERFSCREKSPLL